MESKDEVTVVSDEKEPGDETIDDLEFDFTLGKKKKRKKRITFDELENAEYPAGEEDEDDDTKFGKYGYF